MGIFADKEYKKIIALTAPLASAIFTIETPNNSRALSAKDLATEISFYNIEARPMNSLKEAVEASFLLAGEDDVIIAFGSLSYLGDLINLVTFSSSAQNE